jgi:hypothetical protein
MPNVYIISESNIIVDAFGTMKLFSQEYPCLRLTQENLTISHTMVGVDTTRIRGYHLYAQNMAQVHITGILENQFNQSTVTVNGFNFAIPVSSSGVYHKDGLVNDYFLSQNFPNPFNPSTVISYRVPVSGNVTLKVYDLLGREVATLVDEYKPAGSFEVEFNTSSINYHPSSGVYFYQLIAGGYSSTKQMLLLK